MEDKIEKVRQKAAEYYQSQLVDLSDERVLTYFTDPEKGNRIVIFNDGTAQCVFFDKNTLNRETVGWFGKAERSKEVSDGVEYEVIKINSTHAFISNTERWRLCTDKERIIKQDLRKTKGFAEGGYVDLKATGLTLENAKVKYQEEEDRFNNELKAAEVAAEKAEAKAAKRQAMFGMVGLKDDDVNEIKSEIKSAVADAKKQAADTLKQGLGKLFGKK